MQVDERMISVILISAHQFEQGKWNERVQAISRGLSKDPLYLWFD